MGNLIYAINLLIKHKKRKKNKGVRKEPIKIVMKSYVS